MQQEEAGEPQLADHPQLLLQPPPRLRRARACRRSGRRSARRRARRACGRRLVLRARIAVAVVAGEVERAAAPPAARSRPPRPGARRTAVSHLARRPQHRLPVAPPRSDSVSSSDAAQPDRDERILERRAGGIVGMDVAGRHAWHPQPLGESRQPAVAGQVVAPQRALELDPEAIAAEGGRRAAARAPRQTELPEADGRPPARSKIPASAPSRAQPERQTSPLGAALERFERERGGEGSRARAPGRVRRAPPSAAGRDCASPRPTRPAGSGGNAVRPSDRQLRADDRPDPERLGRLGELHRAPDAVVVGDRERLVALRCRRRGELVRAARRRRGTRSPSGNGARRRAHARCLNQCPRSRKTTTQRPSASASSK